MRYSPLLFLLALLFVMGCKPSTVTTELASTSIYHFNQDSTEILYVLESQRQAWNNADIEGFMKGYWNSDSMTFMGSRGVTYGWQPTLENYKKGYPDKEAMGTLTFNITDVRSLGPESARVLGQFILERKDDRPSGWFTLIMQKMNGRWVVTHDMTVATPDE